MLWDGQLTIQYDTVEEFNVDSKAESVQLNLADVARKKYKKKKLKQTNASAHLVLYGFKIRGNPDLMRKSGMAASKCRHNVRRKYLRYFGTFRLRELRKPADDERSKELVELLATAACNRTSE